VEDTYRFKHAIKRRELFGAVFVMLALLMIGIASLFSLWRTHAASPATWTTYMGNNAHSGYSLDTQLNASNAARLKVLWKYKAGGAINTQPIVANNTLYWGAWDGNEYASDLQGKVLWKTYLGTTTPENPQCSPSKAGVASTATVAQIPLNGINRAVLLLGGGDSSFYALDASSGKIIWRTALGGANTMIWDAPAVYNGSVYIGLSSYGDCPLTPGKLVQLNAATGQIQHSFQTVPNGCVGGGIWGAPTIDEASGTVFVSTGTIATCKGGEPMSYALVALKASDLSLIGSWQVPATQRGADSDFGSTPTLFNATINGIHYRMVGLVNKNGIYYALDSANIKAGPLWQKTLALTAPGSKSSFSSSAWDGTHLYTGDAGTMINGQKCGGSLRAHDPATGNYLWEYCAGGRVVGALTVTPSLVMAGANMDFVVLDSHTGKQLYLYHDGDAASRFWGSPTIVNGVIYMGNRDGYLYAFGL
jgi:polyvinyl alcohol dehydrogenase (cytochrome)